MLAMNFCGDGMDHQGAEVFESFSQGGHRFFAIKMSIDKEMVLPIHFITMKNMELRRFYKVQKASRGSLYSLIKAVYNP